MLHVPGAGQRESDECDTDSGTDESDSFNNHRWAHDSNPYDCTAYICTDFALRRQS